MACEPTVFVVDDDPAVRKSLERLGESLALPVEGFASAQEFLAAFDPARPGCVVLDLRMPGMSGLELQERLWQQGMQIPVIMVTAYGDIPSAVRAMRHGAIDFIEKPYRPQSLLERINEALTRDRDNRVRRAQEADSRDRVATLSPREHQVMRLLAAGRSAKQIGAELGVSHKTVQVHRARIFEKLKITSVAELVRLAVAADPSSGAHLA